MNHMTPAQATGKIMFA